MPLPQPYVADLLATVADARPRLALPDAATRVRPGKWSPRELLGYLIDSAANNHQRFVRARFQSDLVFAGYDQDDWVSAQRYQESPWPELVELWSAYNAHLARVMAGVPDEVRLHPHRHHNLDALAWRPVPAGTPATLDYFMADYVGHCRHHLEQLLGPARTTASAAREGRVASPPAMLVVAGASGAGKTAAVQALQARQLPGVRCHYFDAIGVPSAEEMEREFGGSEQWQAAMTHRWIERLTADAGGGRIAVLDGQVRPSVVRAALAGAGVRVARIVLLDCTPAVRLARLSGPRAQPELATARMDAWAAYLRGQADAFGLPVLDTSGLTVAATADELQRQAEALQLESERRRV
jgi:hypothetical protein